MVTKRYHILIDLEGVESPNMTHGDNLKKFLNELPGVIDMHVLTTPLIAEGIPENPGLSGFVIIDYSHISIHTFTAKNEALVDIFSCKPYKQEDAIGAVTKHFNVPTSSANIQVVSWG